jgi:PAS domain S-box-containing protein
VPAPPSFAPERTPPPTESPRPGRAWLARLAPLALFLVLSALTGLVWMQQVDHRRDLVRRHLENVCTQTANRLGQFLQTRLAVATLFGRRWATHGQRDFSRQRFEEFASILLRELPGYESVRLIPALAATGDDRETFALTRRGRTAWGRLGPEREHLLRQALDRRAARLSPPILDEHGAPSLFAAIPLLREAEHLGFLVVELDLGHALEEIFPARLRSEYSLEVLVGTNRFFRSPDHARISSAALHSEEVLVEEQRFRLALAPIRESEASAWLSTLPVPLLGLVLAVFVSGLVRLLLERVRLLRAARDQAIAEMAERERAKDALSSSEARYLSVFESATEGLLVLDTEDCILEANPAACSMHGYKDHEMVGRSFADLIAPSFRATYEEFKRQLVRGEPARLDSMNLGRDGTPFDVELRGRHLRHAGELRYILTDLRDRKRATELHTVLSRKVLMAQEEERARVSRELHDELGQIITAIRLELGFLKKRLAIPNPQSDTLFWDSNELISKAANELRRICRGLRPPMLDDLGLEPAAQQLIEEFEERTGIAVEQEVQLSESEGAIPAEVALCTYRILQEALNNISRHAAAHNVCIRLLGPREEELQLSVSDDGRGFDPGDPATREGCGMAGMVERSILVNGTLDIRSAVGTGTKLEFRVPQSGRSSTGHSTGREEP